MRKIVTCYHPNLVPTAWNQPKPEPTKVETCECGENWICPVCGFGKACWPCGCMRKQMKKRVKSHIFK